MVARVKVDNLGPDLHVLTHCCPRLDPRAWHRLCAPGSHCVCMRGGGVDWEGAIGYFCSLQTLAKLGTLKREVPPRFELGSQDSKS